MNFVKLLNAINKKHDHKLIFKCLNVRKTEQKLDLYVYVVPYCKRCGCLDYRHKKIAKIVIENNLNEHKHNRRKHENYAILEYNSGRLTCKHYIKEYCNICNKYRSTSLNAVFNTFKKCKHIKTTLLKECKKYGIDINDLKRYIKEHLKDDLYDCPRILKCLSKNQIHKTFKCTRTGKYFDFVRIIQENITIVKCSECGESLYKLIKM